MKDIEIDLSLIKTINEVATENQISRRTLRSRIDSRGLVPDKDYKILGDRLPILLSPKGVQKILD